MIRAFQKCYIIFKPDSVALLDLQITPVDSLTQTSDTDFPFLWWTLNLEYLESKDAIMPHEVWSFSYLYLIIFLSQIMLPSWHT